MPSVDVASMVTAATDDGVAPLAHQPFPTGEEECLPLVVRRLINEEANSRVHLLTNMPHNPYAIRATDQS